MNRIAKAFLVLATFGLPGLTAAQPAPAAGDLSARLKAAGVTCTVTAQADYGGNAEAACQEGMGYLLLAGDPPKPLACADLASEEDGGKLVAACRLPANREPLALVDTLLQKTGAPCAPVARGYVGADDSRYYFEAVCDSGKGYVLSQSKAGAGPTATACNAQFKARAADCDLTRSGLAAARTAETHRLAVLSAYLGAAASGGGDQSQLTAYADAAKASGLDCNLGPMAQRGSNDELNVIEFRCADKNEGRIGVFYKNGKPPLVYDCALAKIAQLTCVSTKEAVDYPRLNTAIRTLDYHSECRVDGSRLMGLSQSGKIAYLEVSCDDPSLDGQVLAFDTATLKATAIVDCAGVSNDMAGGCRLPGAIVNQRGATGPLNQGAATAVPGAGAYLRR